MKKIAVTLTAALLAACGGGGGGSGQVTSGTDGGNRPLAFSGVVAVGAPFANARVQLKCRTGTGESATDATGGYQLAVAGGQLPCVARAAGRDGAVMYSATLQEGVFNITPLTDLMTANLGSELPSAFFESFNDVRASRISTEAIKQAQLNVRGYLAEVDLAIVSDFVTTPFTADGKHPVGAALDELGRKVDKPALALIRDTLASVYVDTVAPTVALAVDRNVVTEPGALVLEATATDNLGIAMVEFLEDGVVVETVKSRPFVSTRSYTADKNGTHSFVARAFDAAGNLTISNRAEVRINIVSAPPLDTTPPAVAIKVASRSVTVAGAFLVEASASDNVGVARVEFYRDGTLLNTDSTAPFEYVDSLTRAIQGNVTYSAKAYDAAGNGSAGASTAVFVNIVPADGESPAGTLTADRQTITGVGQIVNLNATGAASAGVSTVEIREDNTVLQKCRGTTCSATVSFNTLAQNGLHSYGIVVCDIYALCWHSAALVNVSVNLPLAQFDRTPPSISGLMASTSTVSAAQTVTLSAQVTDGASGSGITKVEFYEIGNPSPIATVSSIPYQTSVSYNIGDNGIHRYFIKAYDGAINSSGTSAANVSDNQSLPTEVVVNIAVPPVADAGPSQTAFLGRQVTLDGSASSDPTGKPLSYKWTVKSQPAGSFLSFFELAQTAKPTFRPTAVGNYVFDLSVSNGTTTSPSAETTVTVTGLGPLPPNTGLIVQDVAVFKVVDEATYVPSLASASSACPGLQAMDVRSDGVLVGVSNIALYELDPVGPGCVNKGATPEWIRSFAISPAGEYFGMSLNQYLVNGVFGTRLYQLNRDGSLKSSLIISGATAYVAGLDFGPDGKLYGLGIVNGGKWGLVQIDTATGQTTLVQILPLETGGDIDIDADGMLRMTTLGLLLKIDARSGTLVSNRQISTLGTRDLPFPIAYAR